MTDRKSVLIIDDDEAVRQSIGDILEDRGYHPLLAKDGVQALELMKREPAPPCVILLDMMMPGMNGWEFLERQRSHPDFAGIPVIVCSAFAESARTVKANAILPKPIQLKSLMSAVKAFCA